MAIPAALGMQSARAMTDYGLPPLTPEEEEGFLSSIGSRTLSGLGAVGNFLDIPGSMLRDTLTGNNPFDQLLSPLTGENRVSGRDMLEQWGVLDPNTPGIDFGDVLGFGAEVLADPLSLLNFGGLGKAGQLASRTGHMDDLLRRAAPGLGKRQSRMRTSFDDLLGHADEAQLGDFENAALGMGYENLDAFRAQHGSDALGGLVGVGLPFMDPLFTLGKSKNMGVGVVAPSAQRARVLSEMTEAFGPQASQAISLHDQYAQKWAQETGGSVDDYFSRLSFKKGEAGDVGQEALYQGEREQPFYSQLEKVIDEKVRGPMSKDQLLATLKNSGVKPEEIEWAQLDELYTGAGTDKLDAENLKGWLGAMSIQPSDIKVIEKSDNAPIEFKQVVEGDSGTVTLLHPDSGIQFRVVPDPESNSGEYLLYMDGTNTGILSDSIDEAIENAEEEMYQLGVAGNARYKDYATEGGTNYREVLLQLPYNPRSVKSFRHGHWQEPNVLAHIRMQDMTDPATGAKQLLVDEIQSDWHQQGRKKGYNKEHQPDGLVAAVEGTRRVVPDAPFKKVWHELAFKKVLYDAAKGGYDEVLWTTGKQQVKRYTSGMADADKAREAGMSGFYDKILPEFAQRYTKKWGGKVGQTQVDLGKGTLDTFRTNFSDLIDGRLADDDGEFELALNDLRDQLSSEGVFITSPDPESVRKAIATLRTDTPIRGRTWLKHLDEIESIVAEAESAGVDGDAFHSLRLTPELKRAVLTDGQPLFQPGKGAVEFSKDNKQAIVTAFAGADISTLAHESGHVFRRWLGEVDQALLSQAEATLGVSGGKWTREAEEAFASGFERYLRDGSAPNSVLHGVFQKFKEWLGTIYKSLTGTPLENQVSPELKKVFDQMLSPATEAGFSGAGMSLAERLAGGMDKVGETLRYGKIPGTEYSPGIHLGQLFDYESKGLGTKHGQDYLGPQATRNDRAANAFASGIMAEPIEQYEHYLDKVTRDLPDIDPAKWTDAVGETKLHRRVKVHNALRKGIEDIEFDKRGLPEEYKDLEPIVKSMREQIAAMPDRELAEGVKSSIWDSDYHDYATRYAYHFPNSKSISGFDSSFLKTAHRSQKGRNDILDMLGGTSLINDLTTNPFFSGISHHIKPSEMTPQFWKKRVDMLQEILHQKGLMNWTYDKNMKLVKWLAGLDPRYAKQNIPLFPHNPLHDISRRLEYGERSIRNAKLIRQQLLEFAVDAGSESPRAVRLDEAARSFSGLDPSQNSKLLAEQAGLDTSYWDEAPGEMFKPRDDVPEDLANYGELEELDPNNLGQDELADELGELDEGIDQPKPENPLKGKYVPRERYDELHKLEEAYKTPEAVETLFAKIIDPINRLWQASVTRAFPSFHIRNLVAGQVQNWIAGGWSLRGMRDAHHILKGNFGDTKSLKDLPIFKGKGYTDAEAAKALADLVYQWKLTGKGQGLAMEGLRGTTLDLDLAGQIPGVRPINFGETMGKYFYNKGSGLQGFNPFSEKFGPYEWGGEVGAYMEGLNRITPFIEFLRKGMSPEAAARKVREIQFDYQCVDEQTEILTQRGWLTVFDLKAGDMALTIDPETRNITWQPVEDVHSYQHDGEMHRWKTSRIDALTTSGHRWLCMGAGINGGHHTLRKPKQHFATSSEIASKNKKVIVGGGIPACEPHGDPLIDEIVELIGWYATEGNPAQTQYGVLVHQSTVANPEYCDEISAMADKLRPMGTVSRYNRDCGYGNIATWYFGKGIGNLVRQYVDHKSLPMSLLLRLDSSQLTTLLLVLMKGDGSKGRSTWAQKSPEMVSAFQALCGMLGIRTNARKVGTRDCYTVTLYESNQFFSRESVDSGGIRKEHYSGVVWCPRTPTGTWFARRNGFTYWTGNSLTSAEKNVFRRAIPFWTFSKNQALHTFDELSQRPGGKLAQLGIRAPNEARTEGEPMPEYLSQTAAIPLGKLPSGSDRYLTGLGLSHEDPLSFLSVREGMPDITDTISELVSRATPLAKLPIEAATGESFFQRGPLGGRELVDMDPTVGRLLTNLGLRDETPGGRAEPLGSTNLENVIANSPLSRFTSTARTLTDPRKREGDLPGLALAGQLLTGARVSDLSPAARDTILREEASASMRERGARTFEKVFYNKQQITEAAEKDPELAREMIKYNRLQRYLDQQQKKRKKEKSEAGSR